MHENPYFEYRKQVQPHVAQHYGQYPLPKNLEEHTEGKAALGQIALGRGAITVPAYGASLLAGMALGSLQMLEGNLSDLSRNQLTLQKLEQLIEATDPEHDPMRLPTILQKLYISLVNVKPSEQVPQEIIKRAGSRVHELQVAIAVLRKYLLSAKQEYFPNGEGLKSRKILDLSRILEWITEVEVGH